VRKRVYLALRRDPHPRAANLGALLGCAGEVLSMWASDVAVPGPSSALAGEVPILGQDGPVASELLQAPV
jgi:hypothetical protein